MDEIEKEARRIAEESLAMGDKGPITSVEGTRNRDATWRDPETDESLREEHTKNRYSEYHG